MGLLKKVLVGGIALTYARAIYVEGLGAVLHSVVGHNLLVAVPPLGEIVHAQTLPGNKPWQHWTNEVDAR